MKFCSRAILIQSNLNVAFSKWYSSSVVKTSYSTLITMCFYFFPQLFMQGHSFSIEIFVPLGLFSFSRTFPCLCILVNCILLFVGCFHCLYYFVCFTFNVLVWFPLGILRQVSPEILFAVSLHNLPMSSQVFLEYHQPSGYFSLIYPLDLLASAQHTPDQFDTHISLQFSVWYLLIYCLHCTIFIPFWFSVNPMFFSQI